jgi:glycosyltransferase involved in cell wall biosynthesis
MIKQEPSPSLCFLHLVRNTVSFDSRVLKETGSIFQAFSECNIFIAGFHEKGFLLAEDIGGRVVRRFSLVTRNLPKNLVFQLIKYIEWHLKIVGCYSKFKIAIIHCHDLVPLAIAVHLKLITGARIIYDAHELETEMYGLSGFRKALAKPLESLLLKFVDYVLTVSPSILSWYRERFRNLPIQLLRNIPCRTLGSVKKNIPLRKTYGLGQEDLLFIYLGGISKGRGVRVILDAFAHSSVRHHVLFMGSGPMQDEVLEAARVNSRIHHLQPVAPAELLDYTKVADLGLCLYEDTCLNHRFCLPNKLFESIVSGLPVLAANLPDQAQLVERYQAGWIVNPDSDSLKNFLAQVTFDQVKKLQAGLLDRASNLTWENEQDNLIDVYNRLLGGAV